MIDLLALCRMYGLLVDREMIKYIRSLSLMDGLVSLLAPGLDLTPQIRKICEDFLTRDAQNKILSRGAALAFLADLSGWLSTDPAQILRAMEMIERKLGRSQPFGQCFRRAGKSESPSSACRCRLVLLGTCGLGRLAGNFIWRAPPFLVSCYWILGDLDGMAGESAGASGEGIGNKMQRAVVSMVRLSSAFALYGMEKLQTAISSPEDGSFPEALEDLGAVLDSMTESLSRQMAQSNRDAAQSAARIVEQVVAQSVDSLSLIDPRRLVHVAGNLVQKSTEVMSAWTEAEKSSEKNTDEGSPKLAAEILTAPA